jgi:hypothetical protein
MQTVFGKQLYIFVVYIFTIIQKTLFSPSYIGEGGRVLVLFFFVCLGYYFFCIFKQKFSLYILIIYQLWCSLTEHAILTAFIELKVRNHCFEFR